MIPKLSDILTHCKKFSKNMNTNAQKHKCKKSYKSDKYVFPYTNHKNIKDNHLIEAITAVCLHWRPEIYSSKPWGSQYYYKRIKGVKFNKCKHEIT